MTTKPTLTKVPGLESAFSSPGFVNGNGDVVSYPDGGMSKREFAAIKFAAALIMRDSDRVLTVDEVTQTAIQQADNLLEELSHQRQ